MVSIDTFIENMAAIAITPVNALAINARGGHSGHGGHGGGHGHKGGYALVADDDSCCPPVIDPLTLLTVLASIAAITVGLRQVVISNITARKKRDTSFLDKVAQVMEAGKR